MSRRGDDYAKQSQFLRSGQTRGRLCKTNPISGPAGPPRTPDCARRSQFFDCGLRIADSERHAAHRQGLQGRLYKQTQLAPAGKNRWGKPGPQTRFIAFGSPIHPTRGSIAPNKANFRHGVRRGKGLAGKELWLIEHPIDLGKTKPIARSGAPRRCPAGGGWDGARGTRDEGQCAKRTQFGPDGAWVAVPGTCLSCETKPIPGASERASALREGVVVNSTFDRPRQNKPNFRLCRDGRGLGAGAVGQSCETKPIRARLSSSSSDVKPARPSYAASHLPT